MYLQNVFFTVKKVFILGKYKKMKSVGNSIGNFKKIS